MIRADRQVNDRNEILEIMRGCDALHLAFTDGDYPYVIPMNFGFEDMDGRLTIYLHGAKEGKKHELMRKNPHVAFSMSRAHEMIAGKVPCASTFKYESVCGRGVIEVVGGDERMHALTVIMRQYDHAQVHVFSEKHAAAVTLLKITVEELTGKRRFRK